MSAATLTTARERLHALGHERADRVFLGRAAAGAYGPEVAPVAAEFLAGGESPEVAADLLICKVNATTATP